MQPEQKIRIAIVDDHPIVTEGLQRILMESYSYVSTICFTTGNDFMQYIRDNEHSIDIVLLDITLPDANGTELCRVIKKSYPAVTILAFSNHNNRSTIMQMLHNGAAGYLLKNASAQEVLECIQLAINGEIALSREVKNILAKPATSDLKSAPVLTQREKQILQLIANGETSAAIAEKLYLSPLTVETHRRNLLQKFEVKNVAMLIKEAVSRQYLTE